MEESADRGVRAFVTDVVQRGGSATQLKGSRSVRVKGVDGRSCVVRVRSTTRDQWMARRQDGTPGSDPTGSSYWVFVDLGKEYPEFYMVESDEVESGIAADVELWLAERPGRVPTGSHPIPMSSIAHGHDRWDLLNLNRVRDSRHSKEVLRPRTRPAKATKPVAEPEFVDPRTAIVADFGGYRIQARFDQENSNVEITRGPMEGRRFSHPTTAANAVTKFVSDDDAEYDGWTFWRLDDQSGDPLGKRLLHSG
ncbi:hypothetical protein EV641_103364 [Rhodococcus sp. SMB37]|uniref:hypothetical protein n=1 Tax=Rhodococcus sp. SMB37 TaxID=2512213 RepID=UPI0006CFF59E|nr:hypothetical protein [Rhodococcus sp. SMB37]TCN56016.1 hypothetical protein EV641_103364 [Rhodococcus sp. SMB37]